MADEDGRLKEGVCIFLLLDRRWKFERLRV